MVRMQLPLPLLIALFMFLGTIPSTGTVNFAACKTVELLSYEASGVVFFDLVTRKLPLLEVYVVWQSFGAGYAYSDPLQQPLLVVPHLDMGRCKKLCDANSQSLLCLSTSFSRSC